jgi:hypothetical protein
VQEILIVRSKNAGEITLSEELGIVYRDEKHRNNRYLERLPDEEISSDRELIVTWPKKCH